LKLLVALDADMNHYHYLALPPNFSTVLNVPNPNIAITNSIITSRGISGPVMQQNHCNRGLMINVFANPKPHAQPYEGRQPATNNE
jgi:hypothetical protein